MEFDGLTPEQMQQLLRLGTLNQNDALLQDQLKQAIAMGQPVGTEHTTPLGAALGGIGDIIRGVGSGMKQHDIRGKQQKNLADEEQARALFAQLLRTKPQPQTLDAGVAPPTDGGFYG